MAFYLIKGKTGTYSPCDESDFEQSKGVGVGNVVKCTASRNYLFHKKFFALIKVGFDAQDKHKNIEWYRKALVIRAGFFDLIDVDGTEIPQAQSLSFDNMGAERFEKIYNAVLDIIYDDMSGDTTKDELIKEVEQFI